jgi:hypothetical protein
MNCWYSHNRSAPTLHVYICWYNWLERNLVIFESRLPSYQKVIHLALVALEANKKHTYTPIPRAPKEVMTGKKIVGWFDGASQQNSEHSGAGGVIKIREHTFYKWMINCGAGTNTRDELLGVWALLTLASPPFIYEISVLGDSRIVIDWLK